MTAINDFLNLLDQGGDVSSSSGSNASLSQTQTVVKNLDGTISTSTVITNNTNNTNNTNTNSTIAATYQVLPEGFGSYLQGILPDDVATAAGAFSATMQQIKNIRKIDIEKFAQVVASLETNTGLPLTNGTNLPTDTTEAKAALAIVALGSGPQGTYTFSDFFGCMSGLTYPWKEIQPAILGSQTNTLKTIYQQLYLAVTWKQATLTVTMTSSNYTTSATLISPGVYNYYYQINSIGGVGSFDTGGGYGRGGAAAPTGIINGGSGATITTRIDTDPANVTTTYGKVTLALLNSHGSTVMYGSGSSSTPPTPPTTLTVNIQEPPTTYGGSGWPAMNTAVQHYIDAANTEIASIRTTHPGKSAELNDMWNNLGTQLNIEQRARNTGFSPLPDPRTIDLYPYPTMLYSFTDLLPNYSKLTDPNMAAQTLEAISDLNKNAGQSIVAAMRAERNQARLSEVGITPDDNIPDTLPPGEVSTAYPFNVDPVTTPVAPPNSSVAAVLGIGTIDGLPVPSPDIGIGTPGISQVEIPAGTSPFFDTPVPIESQGGGPIVPGSLAGSPYTELIPPALNPVLTSDVLLPASLTVAQAIEQVVTCNCDCWVQ